MIVWMHSILFIFLRSQCKIRAFIHSHFLEYDASRLTSPCKVVNQITMLTLKRAQISSQALSVQTLHSCGFPTSTWVEVFRRTCLNLSQGGYHDHGIQVLQREAPQFFNFHFINFEAGDFLVSVFYFGKVPKSKETAINMQGNMF